MRRLPYRIRGGHDSGRGPSIPSTGSRKEVLMPHSSDFTPRSSSMQPRTREPEPWLRGPVPGIPPLLQPAAHAFLLALEDAETAASGLSTEQLWQRLGGAASAGFHLMHLAGSTDRLLTYARDERLSEAQRAALAAEKTPEALGLSRDALLNLWRTTVDLALRQLALTPESTLGDARFVGRDRLPSTVLGLLFHAAEHAQRHAGQLVTTAKIIRGSG